MTDKQIIIDGVDVSECASYMDNGECISELVYSDYCKVCPNCTYKLEQKLKAKEQECEELKEYFETAKEASNCNLRALGEMTEWADKLDEENDQLKEQLKAKEQECEEKSWEIGNLGYKIKNQRKEINIRLEQLDQLKTENKILKEKFEIAIKNNMDKTLLRLENGDVKEELQEIREEFGIETLYCHDDNTRVHRCIKLLQLKDCLTEIKEIAEAHKKDESVWNPYRQLDKILQKISECEGNNEIYGK